MSTTSRRPAGPTLLLAAAATALGGAARAQNALGDGRGLDATPQVGATSNAPVRDLQAEVAFRNAIVTGNAGNFQSFRGDVGYSAAGEFRGFLGSDETFAFRRDSLISGLAGLGIRGTSALQYQFALSTGSTPPDGLVGGFSVGRGGFSVANPGASTPPAGAAPGGFQADPASLQGLRRAAPDPFEARGDDGTLLNALRSPSIYTANQGLSQVFLARFDVREMPGVALTASELRSVRAARLAVDQEFGRFATPEGEEDEQPAGTAAPLDTRIEPTGGPAGPANIVLPEVNPQTVHAELLERFDATPRNGVSTRGQLEILRRMLTAPELFDRPDVPTPGAAEDPAADDADGATPSAAALDAGPEAVPDAPPAATANAPEVSRREQDLRRRIRSIDPTVLKAIRSTERVNRLIDEDRARGTAYGEHVMAGERLLARGRFFEAEERFVNALSLRRGDVTTRIGRVHAQLGAGLFVSAAVNLRAVLIENPEVAGARFSRDLLPRAERLAEVRADLNALIDSRRGDDIGLAAALLLGFIGYQTDDRAAIERAFTVIDAPGVPAPTDVTDARLAALLRTVWLEPDADANAEPGPNRDPEPRANPAPEPGG